jgi:hypothetical protein
METHALAQRVLVRAARRIGGAEALAAHLRVAPARLARWLAGKEVPPTEILLRAVDVVVDERD